MTTRQPIDPADIRVGDLVRWESATRSPGFPTAHEWVAIADGDDWAGEGQHYLLERRPLVKIPQKPGLGWLRGYDKSLLAIWKRGNEGLEGESTPIYRVHEDITDWVPATAVPTAALDELRTYIDAFQHRADTPAKKRIADFLAAVDEANGAS